ncbi:sensor histidine kinase [Streptomyces sp. NPDC048282]|uniref:sensor histidine kinase n=1 Tax=Streptomyces sp. NPDC048282 TaxID=3365528 RepID=UPI00371A6B78
MTSPPRTEPAGDPSTLLGDSEHRMIVRLLSWSARVNRADQAHPRVRRWGLPALLAIFGLPALAKAVGGAGPGVPAVVALVLGLTVPLLWRERRPMPVFAVVAAVSVADMATGVMTGSNASRLVALYNVARLGTPVELAVAFAVSLPEAVVTGLILSSYGPTAYLTQVPAMVTVLVVGTLAAVGLGLAGRIVRAYVAALEDRAVRLEIERDQRARLAVAGERARVAREMHDILGHTLSVMVGLADGAAGLAETSPRRGAETLRIIADSGRGALAELRRLLAVVRADDREQTAQDPLAPQPSLADLDALLERVRAAGPTVTLHTEGELTGLGQGVQLAVYRIVQEALTNTLKYAAADTTVSVVIAVEPDAVDIAVEDSGPALAPPPGADRDGGGHGLVGMRERAALYGGQAGSGPNSRGGWTVRARLLPPPPHPPAHTESPPA